MPNFTAAEIIAIVAIVVGPVVGLITGLRLQGAQTKADLEKARIERVQRNRTATYVDVMEHVYRTLDFVTRTLPIMSWAGAPGPPEFPADDDIRSLNARVAAFGSPEVLARLEALYRLANEFTGAVFVFQSYEQGGTLGPENAIRNRDARLDVETQRKAFLEASKGLREAINRELAA